MKKLSVLAVIFFSVILIACSGSETYRGSWKVVDMNGAKFEIVFDAKKFSIKDSLGKSTEFEYTQNSVNISNGVETYGIQLGDGRTYQIHFPKAGDESIGIMKDENGAPMYSISRKEYMSYDAIYKLK